MMNKSKQKQSSDGDELVIGSKCRVYIDDTDTWFNGTVTQIFDDRFNITVNRNLIQSPHVK